MTSVVIEDSPPIIEPSYYQTSIMNDNYLIFSIVLTLVSILFGCIPALCCSIPAVVYAAKVSHYNT